MIHPLLPKTSRARTIGPPHRSQRKWSVVVDARIRCPPAEGIQTRRQKLGSQRGRRIRLPLMIAAALQNQSPYNRRVVTKRKRTVLSIAEKADLIRRMRNGESQRQLAFEYGIGTSTVSDVKKHEAEILRYVETNGDFVAMNRRKLEAGAKVDVEEAVFDWLMKEMRAGRELSPSDVMSKARAEHHRLRGNEEFRASTGWLERFKRRYNIHSFRPGEEDLWKPTLGRSSNCDSAFGSSHARRKDAATTTSKKLPKMSGKRSFKNRSLESSSSPTTIKAETDSHEEYDYADMRTDTISPDLSNSYHPQVSLEEGHLNLDLPPVEEIPSAGEAASMLSKALVWAAAQPETAPQELFVLKQLQTKAALKCLLKATQ
ncbi:uncharacterized protein [Macrobrachium rosenbergii]|uniref:uncharacterized protein isoform X2 n=1 Tax=Macrobrachium rosenbergii TaxID=79674 RepID=UPI0034D5109D